MRRSPRYEPIEGWKCIARSGNGAVLSINKDTYTVIDHGEMGGIVEAVLAQPNVKWETAGVLDGGRAVWCLALLDEPVEFPGDDSPTLPYLAITNRHDGTAACARRATAVRIVCANTFRAAELEGERTGATFSFIHKSSWRNRIEEARQAVTGARAEMRRYTELASELLAIPITPRRSSTGHCRWSARSPRHKTRAVPGTTTPWDSPTRSQKGTKVMNLISTSWSCLRCGAAFISTPPDHGLCDQCIADLEALARLAVPAPQPCPACGGPVCAAA